MAMENSKFEKLTVLIAEDEIDLREMYVKALISKGFNVLEARNGKEVIDFLANRNDIKILLLDVVMPDMDGFEVLEKLNKEKMIGKFPIIVSTNLDNFEDKENALRLGADEYFVKSKHTPMELVEIVQARCV